MLVLLAAQGISSLASLRNGRLLGMAVLAIIVNCGVTLLGLLLVISSMFGGADSQSAVCSVMQLPVGFIVMLSGVFCGIAVFQSLKAADRSRTT